MSAANSAKLNTITVHAKDWSQYGQTSFFLNLTKMNGQVFKIYIKMSFYINNQDKFIKKANSMS